MTTSKDNLITMINSLDEARQEQLNPILIDYIDDFNNRVCQISDSILGTLWVFNPEVDDYLYVEVLLDCNIKDESSPLYQQINRKDEIRGFEMYITHIKFIDNKDLSTLYSQFMKPLWDNIFVLSDCFMEILQKTNSGVYTKEFICE